MVGFVGFKLAAFGFDGIQISVPKSNHIKENPKILSYAALKSNHGRSIKAMILKLCFACSEPQMA